MTRFGFDADKHPAYLTMALGAGSVTPWQLPGLCGLRQRRLSRQPLPHRRVTDANGKTLIAAQPCARASTPNRAVDARNAFMMDSMMRDVTKYGTAAARGTTLKRHRPRRQDRHHQRLARRLVRRLRHGLVGVAWVGFDQPRPLGDRETGGGLALPIWMPLHGTDA